jgi:hypothetical protein
MKLKDLTMIATGIRLHNRNGVGNKIELALPYMVYSGQDVHINVENLKLIPLNYDVEIANKDIARFTSRDERFKVVYYIALETDE